ncbi:hypothetical protein ABFA25_04225 [Mycobacterium lepromatosis]|uniref:hypothetical protein n=1 Tax=Mycobacterium lepromatosis TaxID=480418 RepID=UPI003D8052FB
MAEVIYLGCCMVVADFAPPDSVKSVLVSLRVLAKTLDDRTQVRDAFLFFIEYRPMMRTHRMKFANQFTVSTPI